MVSDTMLLLRNHDVDNFLLAYKVIYNMQLSQNKQKKHITPVSLERACLPDRVNSECKESEAGAWATGAKTGKPALDHSNSNACGCLIPAWDHLLTLLAASALLRPVPWSCFTSENPDVELSPFTTKHSQQASKSFCQPRHPTPPAIP